MTFDDMVFDGSPDEIESREELDFHLDTGSLAGLTVQGLRLDVDPPDLSAVDLTGAAFVGCRFVSADAAADLVRRGAYVVPAFTEVPYPTQPARLYAPGDLAAGFGDGGFASMYDTIVYQHFVAHGGPLPDVREALAQRLHDSGIDDALTDTMADWSAAGGGKVVGIMGGHAERRGSKGYRLAAEIGQDLARAGCLVVTGGGPGVMEAANLGAYLVDGDLAAAVETLSAAPDFHEHDPYTKIALDVRSVFGPADDLRPHASPVRGGLAVPTWLYGHEPANLFAARIAKYFSNAIREDVILRLARGGIVFAAGRAGTVQEVFQAATKTFYATDGPSGPFVFLDVAFWTDTLPVESLLRPLFAASPHGDLTGLIHLTDDPAEAVAIITGP